MKKVIDFPYKLFLSCLLIFTFSYSFAQTSSDTIKTGKANDPMVVNPGKANDSIAVNPGKTNDPMAAMTDTGFINKNIMDNMMEIKLAKLGRDKGTSPAVKKVAALMISDHTTILNDLQKLAEKKENGRRYGHMQDMPSADIPAGNDFNTKWASAMLTMHEAKIDELEKFISATRDEGIKDAISKALPKIKAHKDLLAKIPGAKVTEEPNSVIQ
ncbi:DUF4142 domain-containing protein [Segetibacter koreensis]|uniref:DUF4142 domain-containing protein n=1 Tax=Segetibacter koreensis TaxID=398037 RepID=UPI000375E948|nr:DUF4142 domain-containing protein [Segetibacter koreensis]